MSAFLHKNCGNFPVKMDRALGMEGKSGREKMEISPLERRQGGALSKSPVPANGRCAR
jgi:hypothetical protein